MEAAESCGLVRSDARQEVAASGSEQFMRRIVGLMPLMAWAHPGHEHEGATGGQKGTWLVNIGP